MRIVVVKVWSLVWPLVWPFPCVAYKCKGETKNCKWNKEMLLFWLCRLCNHVYEYTNVIILFECLLWQKCCWCCHCKNDFVREGKSMGTMAVVSWSPSTAAPLYGEGELFLALFPFYLKQLRQATSPLRPFPLYMLWHLHFIMGVGAHRWDIGRRFQHSKLPVSKTFHTGALTELNNNLWVLYAIGHNSHKVVLNFCFQPKLVRVLGDLTPEIIGGLGYKGGAYLRKIWNLDEGRRKDQWTSVHWNVWWSRGGSKAGQRSGWQHFHEGQHLCMSQGGEAMRAGWGQTIGRRRESRYMLTNIISRALPYPTPTYCFGILRIARCPNTLALVHKSYAVSATTKDLHF